MAVRLSVRTHRITWPPLDELKKKLIIENFVIDVEKLHVLLNSDVDNGYLHKDKEICKTTLPRILLRKIRFPKEFVKI